MKNISSIDQIITHLKNNGHLDACEELKRQVEDSNREKLLELFHVKSLGDLYIKELSINEWWKLLLKAKKKIL